MYHKNYLEKFRFLPANRSTKKQNVSQLYVDARRLDRCQLTVSVCRLWLAG